jgi:hypothetical protein
MGALRKGASEADMKVVKEVLQERGGACIDPKAFVQTARPADASTAAASNNGNQAGFRGPRKRGRCVEVLSILFHQGFASHKSCCI